VLTLKYQGVQMTITEYISTVPRDALMNICLEMAQDDRSNIEYCIDRLIDAKPDLEEDDSTYSQLVPRLQKRFTDALQEAQIVLEYERMLDKNDCI
jgi:hypothetical protein